MANWAPDDVDPKNYPLQCYYSGTKLYYVGALFDQCILLGHHMSVLSEHDMAVLYGLELHRKLSRNRKFGLFSINPDLFIIVLSYPNSPPS